MRAAGIHLHTPLLLKKPSNYAATAPAFPLRRHTLVSSSTFQGRGTCPRNVMNKNVQRPQLSSKFRFGLVINGCVTTAPRKSWGIPTPGRSRSGERPPQSTCPVGPRCTHLRSGESPPAFSFANCHSLKPKALAPHTSQQRADSYYFRSLHMDPLQHLAALI